MSTSDSPLPLLRTMASGQNKSNNAQREPAGAFVAHLVLCILSIFSWISIGINASGGSLEINPITLSFSENHEALDPISLSVDAAKISLCLALGWLAVKRARSAFLAATVAWLLLFMMDLIVHIYVLASPRRRPSRWGYVGSGWVKFLSVIYVLFRVYALTVLFKFGYAL